MPNPNLNYLRAFFNAYNLVGIKTAQRIRDALTDTESGTYTFERANGDQLGFYNDVIAAWYGIASATPVAPTPVVMMKISMGDTVATATVSLGLAATANPVSTALFKAEPPFGTNVPIGDVTVTLNAPDLDVDLQNLGGLTTGTYVGTIMDGTTSLPILEVQLAVV